jgi:general secretion pathway protein I
MKNNADRTIDKQSGFTLLEVLVATVILAVAIAGLMSALTTSLRTAARVTDYDRAAMLARRKMDEITADKRLPRNVLFEGAYNPAETNGSPSGWRARISPFEFPPNPTPGVPVVDRMDVEVWWMDGATRRTFNVEGFRRYYLKPQDVVPGMTQ